MQPRQFVSNLSVNYSGGYTLIPVLNGHCLDMPFHIKRLADSYVNLCHDTSISYEILSNSVLNEIHNLKLQSSSTGFLTIAAVKSNDSISSMTNGLADSSVPRFEIKSLYTENIKNYFADPSNTISSSSTSGDNHIIETFPFQRSLPGCKDIRWPTQRAFIEQQRSLQHSTEIILTDNGHYLEGLTSNFFAINTKSKVIYTCTDESSVLEGSMSKLFRDFCRQKEVYNKFGLQFDDTLPLTNDILATCDAAFLTSATKPIFPITSLYDYHINNSQYNQQKDQSYQSKILYKKFEFPCLKLLQDLRFLFIQGLKCCLPYDEYNSGGSFSGSERDSGHIQWFSTTNADADLSYQLWWSAVPPAAATAAEHLHHYDYD
jgi:hypothetical protein